MTFGRNPGTAGRYFRRRTVPAPSDPYLFKCLAYRSRPMIDRSSRCSCHIRYGVSGIHSGVPNMSRRPVQWPFCVGSRYRIRRQQHDG